MKRNEQRPNSLRISWSAPVHWFVLWFRHDTWIILVVILIVVNAAVCMNMNHHHGRGYRVVPGLSNLASSELLVLISAIRSFKTLCDFLWRFGWFMVCAVAVAVFDSNVFVLSSWWWCFICHEAAVYRGYYNIMLKSRVFYFFMIMAPFSNYNQSSRYQAFTIIVNRLLLLRESQRIWCDLCTPT